MKKVLVVVMAMVFVSGFIVDMALALDVNKLQIEGEAFVRAWSMENYSDGDSGDNSDKINFFDEKFRVQLTFPASDHIKAVGRFDFAETQWGSDNMQAYRPEAGTNDQLQVDRAYLQYDKGMFQLRAGLQYIDVGTGIAFRDNMPGLLFRVNTPVKFTLGYVKRNENGSLSDEEISGVDYGDVDRFLAELQYGIDNFEIKGFYVVQTDASGGKDQPNVFGLAVSYGIDKIKLTSELDIFGGESGSTDYTGTQLWANITYNVNKKLTLMSDLVYSAGESDVDKEKITVMGDPFGTQKFTEGGWGTKLWDGDLGPLGNGDIYDPLDGNAGAIGGSISAKYSITDDLDLFGQAVYLTAEENISTAYDTAMVGNLGIRYKLLPELILVLAYNHTNIDMESGSNRDSANCFHSAVYYSF
ncbi:MAG: hypothetical protein K8S18_16835 [Desulfobacula sp.]|nr:hypothetical protein [Desulfobacula sp.]